MNTRRAISLIVSLSVMQGVFGDELAINGSFEAPVVTTGSFSYASGSDLPGWSIHGEINIVSSSYWQPGDGSQSIDLVSDPWGHGIGPGTYIEQAFPTVPGFTYELSFLYGNNPAHAFASADVSVVGATQLVATSITHSGSGYDQMNYQVFSTQFVSDSTTTSLRFTHTDSPAPEWSGIALDKVSVKTTAVPEPSTMATLLVGGCLLLLRRRCSV